MTGRRKTAVVTVPLIVIAAIFATRPAQPKPLELPANVRKHFENLGTVDLCTIDLNNVFMDNGFDMVGKWPVLDRLRGVSVDRVLPNLSPSDSGALCFLIQDPNDRGNYVVVCSQDQWLE